MKRKMNFKKVKKLSVLFVLLVFSVQTIAQVTPLTLKMAVAYALKNKTDISKAALDVENAQYQLDETKAGGLPQISGSSSMNYSPLLQKTALPGEITGNPGKTTLLALGQKWSVNTGVTVSQKLLDESLKYSIKSKKTTKEYYQLYAKLTDEQVIENVANNYYQVLVQQQKIVVVDSNISSNTKIKNIIKGQYDNGLGKKIDLDRILVTISNLNSQRQQLINAVQLQENSLKFYMGMPADTMIELPRESGIINPSAAILGDTLDINSRNDYKVLQKQGEIFNLNRQLVKTMYHPTLSFSGNLNYQGIGNTFPIGKGSSKGASWFGYSTVGITLNVPIFNGGATKAKLKQTDVSIRKLNEDIKNTSLTLNYEFERAKIQISNSLITLKNQQENTKLAEDVFLNTKNNYNQGLATLTDLLQAQSSLTEAQNNYSTSLLDYKLAELQLIKSKGQLTSLLN